MNKKKFFGLLTSAAMLLNAAPLSVLAEEMVEASGVVSGAVTNADGSVVIDKANFPDENFLSDVQAAAKADGVTDAAEITSLTVSPNVESLDGLQYLTGLTHFHMGGNNNIGSLDLSNNKELECVVIGGTEVQSQGLEAGAFDGVTAAPNYALYSVTLPATASLETAYIANNPSITTLDLSVAPDLTDVNVSKNGLAQLDLSKNTHLTSLNVNGNKLYSLDTTASPKLATLEAAANKIYELNVAPKSLTLLNVAGNKLRTLDASKMTNLEELNVADNMLESLGLPSSGNINTFNCDQNHLAALDLSDAVAEEANVVTGTQSLFAGAEDEAIDLKAYDENFKPGQTDIIGSDGNPTGTSIGNNGVATLPEEETPATPSTPGGDTPSTTNYTLTAENTTVEYKVPSTTEEPGNSDSEETPSEDNGGNTGADEEEASGANAGNVEESAVTYEEALAEDTLIDLTNYEAAYDSANGGSITLTPKAEDGEEEGEAGPEADSEEASDTLTITDEDITNGDVTITDSEDKEVESLADLAAGTYTIKGNAAEGATEGFTGETTFTVEEAPAEDTLIDLTNYEAAYDSANGGSITLTPKAEDGEEEGKAGPEADSEEASDTLTITDEDITNGDVTITDSEDKEVESLADLAAGTYTIKGNAAEGATEGFTGETTFTVEEAADEATELTADNTKVVFEKDADGNLVPSAIQVKGEDGEWKTIAEGDALADFTIGTPDADGNVTLKLAEGKEAPEGYSLPAEITVPSEVSSDEPGTDVPSEDKYEIVSITIGETKITDANVLANFKLSDVENGKGNLTYAESADDTFKAQYKIDGENGASTISVTATEATASEEAQSAMLEAASVLQEAPIALAYNYDTESDTANQNMRVNVYKENLMNRLYNPNSGEHFYTKDTNEKNTLVKLGWQYEGIGWVAPKASEGTSPVYRLYNKNAGDHHYTMDANEKDTLVRIGWTFEGVGWTSAATPIEYTPTGAMTGSTGNRTIEVFREYNPNAKEAGAHNYTISENENATLVSLGWIDEGIAWNALK